MRALLVLPAVACAALAAAPAHASFPGSNGGLAVEVEEYDRGGVEDHHIQILRRNGKVAARLSHCSRPDGDDPTGVCASDPSFSADGRRIAFDRGRRLAIAAAGGTGLVTLPKLTERDADPAFAPDGTKLVFTGLAHGARDLYTVNLDGSGLEQITRSGGKWPAWSSRGEIAYCDGDRIWRLRPGKPGRVSVARGRHPDWSPSGRSIAFDRKGSVYRVAARRGARRKLVRRHAGRPAYSPDGKRIAFQSGGGAYSSIYTVSARTGRRLKRVRRGGELEVGSVFDYFTTPAWRPLTRRKA